MTEQAGPPQGFETKNTPGYHPAASPAGDHPGHSAGFEGVGGYSNTPGITDPATESADKAGDGEKSGAGGKAATPKTAAK